MKTCLGILGIVLLALFTISMSECDPEGGSTGGTGGTDTAAEPTTPKDRLVGNYDCVLYLRELGGGNKVDQLSHNGTLNLGSSGSWTLKVNSLIAPISWSGPSWEADTTDLTLKTADGFHLIPYKYGDNACQQDPHLRAFRDARAFIIPECDFLLILDRGYLGFNRN